MALSNEQKVAYLKRLLFSRLRLLMNHGFYGLLLMHTTLSIDESEETAYTDGDKIVFGTSFLDDLSDSEVDFIMMHEIMHIVLSHCFRYGKNKSEEDNYLFNIACDIVVNSNILKSNNMDLKTITLGKYGESMHLAPNNSEGYNYTAEEVYDASLTWAKEYDEELAAMLENKEYALKVLSIERGNAKPRKDIAKWSDVKNTICYMYPDKFDKNGEFEYQKVTDKDEIDNIVKTYFEKYYNPADDKQAWFDKMKDLAEEMGYCREVKEYKANPDAYKGHVGDISTVIRVKLTGRCNTPDLYEIMQVLGLDEIKNRI